MLAPMDQICECLGFLVDYIVGLADFGFGNSGGRVCHCGLETLWAEMKH